MTLEVMSKEEAKPAKANGPTKVFIEEFKGSKIFSVFQVDEQGNKAEDRPVVGIGMRKAKALVKHLNELKNWVDGVEGK